ncbi:MAG TPA: prepilin-type N-terminal cleavage/methylation domain-containing protein [Mycobacteriales bacterium]|nr:prepilin-type N-terminal cleavage/methylation domain-containing protein [Mycobacteriales bacterium]
MFDRTCHRRGGRLADDGFGMVEMMAALVLIALVSAASATFFISSISGANGNKVRTTAAYVADEELEQITSLPPTDLVWGRTKTAVTALWATAAATRLKISSQDDLTSTSNYDSVTTHTPYIQTQPPARVVNGTVFNLFDFIDVCWMDVAAGVCGPTQNPANGHSTIKEYRASVDVAWVANGGCHSGCDYSTSTIIDPSSDPTFNSDLDIPVIDTFTPSSFYTNNALVDASTPCVINGTSYAGDLVKVITSSGLDANATVRVSSGGGSVPTGAVIEIGSSEIDFCLKTADVPGNYYVTILNTDGGHANQPITETGVVTSAAWNPSTLKLTLSGTGFEPNATLTDTLAESMTSATIANNYPTADTASVPNYSPPTNGGKDTITITNPDTTTIPYTIFAPRVTSSGLTAYAGQPTNLAVAGSAFASGMTVSTTSGNCTNVSVTVTSAGSATLNLTGGTANTTCVFKFINPDGGTATNITVTNLVTPPQVSNVSPAVIDAGNVQTTISLTGTGFQGGMAASVTSGSCTGVTTPNLSGSTSATLKVTSGTNAGSCTIKLTNPDGGTTSFTVTTTKISISGMTESSAKVRGTQIYTWTVTGTSFSTTGQPTVTLTEKAGSTTQTLTVSGVNVASSTQLSFQATPFNTGKANYTVTVTNPSGATASFALNNFTVT